MIGTLPFTCDALVMPLRDGTPVLVRAVGPEDKPRLQDGLSRMSTWSIYRRFARSLSRLTADELRYLTGVDQENHIAWGAVDPSDPQQTGLGIARLIREPNCPRRAEVAVAVVDQYQRLGLGTILLAALYTLAKTRGMETLRAVVLPDNHVVLAWLLRLGARCTEEGAQTTLDLLPGDTLPANGTARRFQDVVEQVESAWTRNGRYACLREASGGA
jgi:GNAT superfamily N-acetyltransferase